MHHRCSQVLACALLLGVVVALGGCDHPSMSPAAGPASSAPENTDDSRSKGPAPGEGIPSPADARAETAALGWPVMDATTIPVGETPWPLLFAGEPAPECQDGRFGEAAVHLYGPEGRTSVDVVTEAACCGPFEPQPAPPGMAIWMTTCEPWSCGGGCLRTRHLVYVPLEVPALEIIELRCNENLSAAPAGEINDACDEVELSEASAEVILETVEGTMCPGDDGLVSAATIRRQTLTFTPRGIERGDATETPHRPDVWGCDPQPE